MIQLISSLDNTQEKPYLPTRSRKVIDSRKNWATPKQNSSLKWKTMLSNYIIDVNILVDENN